MRLSYKLAIGVVALIGTIGAASAQTNRYTQQQAGPPYDLLFDGGPFFGGPAFDPVEAGYRPIPRARWLRHRAPPPVYDGYDVPAYGDQDLF